MKPRISIVGAGRVGKTLGKCLREQGWRIAAVVTRSSGTAQAAVRAIGGGKAYGSLTPEVPTADIVLVSAPDTAIASVANALAQMGGKAWRGRVALHASGALDRTVLAPLARLGASTGSLHPMQTFSGRGVPKLEGIIFAVEGAARARQAGRAIARTLGGVPLTVPSASKTAYHAAGALAAGHALGLIEAATQILMRVGFPRRRAVQTLLPLTRQMLDNFERLGPRAAWTGPVARGDYARVASHMKALRTFPPEFRQTYAALTRLAQRVLSDAPAARFRGFERALKN